jgi:hypothetical protein
MLRNGNTFKSNANRASLTPQPPCGQGEKRY